MIWGIADDISSLHLWSSHRAIQLVSIGQFLCFAAYALCHAFMFTHPRLWQYLLTSHHIFFHLLHVFWPLTHFFDPPPYVLTPMYFSYFCPPPQTIFFKRPTCFFPAPEPFFLNPPHPGSLYFLSCRVTYVSFHVCSLTCISFAFLCRCFTLPCMSFNYVKKSSIFCNFGIESVI